MTAKAKHREVVMERAQGLCELRALIPGHVCRGDVQAAHLISCQQLRIEQSKARIAERGLSVGVFPRRPIATALLDDLVADGRNGMALCEVNGHQAHDQHRQRIPREALPAHVYAFVAEYRLRAVFDREFPLSREEAA